MRVFEDESYYRDMLAKQVGGRIEVILSFGRADVMTDMMVWEVEPAATYTVGVRQALHYGAMSGLPPAIATYGRAGAVVAIFDHLAYLPAPGVELWWLHGREFVPVRSAEDAAEIAAAQKEAEAPPVPEPVVDALKEDFATASPPVVRREWPPYDPAIGRRERARYRALRRAKPGDDIDALTAEIIVELENDPLDYLVDECVAAAPPPEEWPPGMARDLRRLFNGDR
jgi:hypothetical protein